MTSEQKISGITQLFEGGFRIFFLSAAIYAAMIMLFWTTELAGVTDFADQLIRFPLTTWHAHELIFGFIIAVVAGFLSTAVPVWTGTPRFRGTELKLLFLLWLAGRLAIFFSNMVPEMVVAILDLSLIPILAILVARRIIAKKMWRNLGFIPILLLIMFGNILIYLELLGWTEDTAARGLEISIGLLVVLTVVIGGRVIPVFTGNWLKRNGKEGVPDMAPWIGRITIASCLAAVLTAPLPVPEVITGVLSFLAGTCILFRLSRWRGLATLSDPLVWVLHLGYFLLGAGFLTQALALTTDLIPLVLTQHIFTVGGLGVMILGMMSRIVLGHTGRELKISPVITVAYFLILISLLCRTFPQLFLPDAYQLGLQIAGASWFVAWILYVVIYLPVFLSPRPDGKPG